MSSVIGSLRVDLGLNSAQFVKGTKQAQSAMKDMSAKMAVAGAAIGAALGAATAAFIKLSRDAINTADEISKSAVKIGIGTEELSRLRYAADLSGVSFEQLEKGLLILNRNMAGVGGESAKVSAAFAQMGINTRAADGSLKSSTQVLKEMADVFKNMPDGAEKSALAMAVLGKSGADMIPLINGGSEALQELTDEADRFGVVIDAETGRRAEAFNDNLTRLQGAFSALAVKVSADMLPALVDLTNWLVRNTESIVGFVRWVGNAIQALGIIVGKIVDVARAIYNYLGPALEWAANGLRALGLGGPAGGNSMLSVFAALKANAAAAAPPIKAVGIASEGAGVRLGGMGRATRGTSSALRDMNREAEDAARKLQSLTDRLFPAEAKARKLREELKLLDGSGLPEERQAEARFRLGTEGLGKARVSPWLAEDGPLVDARQAVEETNAALAKDAEIQTVRIAQSYADMARNITSSLQGLANSIKSGGFLGILGGVLDVFTQLAGSGVLGKSLASRFNAPIPGYANGTNYARGGLAWVGERGPELVNLNRGAQVIPNRDLRGGGIAQIVPSPYFDVVIDGKIMSRAPMIASASAALAQGQMAQRAQRRVR